MSDVARLALGTVQFGTTYGIANSSGKPSPEEARRLLQLAESVGIDTLDTAAAYGDSEATLGAIGVAGWNVVTKIPPLPGNCADPRHWLQDQLRASLARLRLSHVQGVLLHNPDDLLGPYGAELALGLQDVKAEGLARKTGYSIYSPDSLKYYMQVSRPDLVQAPLNVLDQRLLQDGWLDRLTDEEVEVHVRSVFLQGLLLLPPHQRPASFMRWNQFLDRWDRFVEETASGNRLAAALGFVKHIAGISKIVLGFDKAQHLEGVLLAYRDAGPADASSLACTDALLIEPRNWTA